MLTNADIAELTDWRRELHRFPELSGEESATAARVVAALAATRPDQVLTGLGGHGVAAVWAGAEPGETVMFRCELDALPIAELGTPPYRSEIPGKGHMCGHDGHMTMLMGLARLISRRPPARGRVVLMFQPAEETGAGAAAVIADPRYGQIRPDWAFAIHNMPGLPLGHVGVQAGTMMCASQGLRIALTGKTAHASMPETGTSPALALSRLIPGLLALGPGGAMEPGFRMVTITHATMGQPAFGISPGAAELWAKLRTLEDSALDALRHAAEALARAEATAQGLTVTFTVQDHFAATVNDAGATTRVLSTLDALHIPRDPTPLPIRPSEDFGRFGQDGCRAAMMFLGSGIAHPALHHPDYDFPDDITPKGIAIFHHLMRDLLG